MAVTAAAMAGVPYSPYPVIQRFFNLGVFARETNYPDTSAFTYYSPGLIINFFGSFNRKRMIGINKLLTGEFYILCERKSACVRVDTRAQRARRGGPQIETKRERAEPSNEKRIRRIKFEHTCAPDKGLIAVQSVSKLVLIAIGGGGLWLLFRPLGTMDVSFRSISIVRIFESPHFQLFHFIV